DSFTYVTQDALGANSNTATVSLSVTAPVPVNQAPVATPDAFTLSQNTTFTTGNVLSNDSDPDNNLPFTAQLVADVTQGSLTLNSNGSFTYIPTTNFTGTDNFTYVTQDALGATSNTATVSLSVTAPVPVNQAPVATPDAFTLSQNTTFTTGNVLSNDSDPDNNLPFTAQLVADVTQGSLTLNSNGSFTYIPTANFTGLDNFTYVTQDALGANSNTATVSLSVTAPVPVNQAPVAVGESFRAVTSTPLTVSAANGVLRNDTDADSSTLTALLVTAPSNGSLALNSNGAFVYTPTTNFSGTDTFVYKANDGNADSNSATVTLTVLGNTAPTANADTYTVAAGVPLTIDQLSGVLRNDSDTEGDTLTANLVTSSNGSLTFNSNGTFTYAPNAGVTIGTDTFVYQVNDGFVNSAPATVTLSIGANAAPIAQNDTYTASAGNTLTVNELSGILANDTDAQPLTVSLVSDTTNGSLTLNSNGSFTYRPNASFTSGIDTFVYQAGDGALTASATVTLNVTSATAPIAQNDAYQVVAGTTLSVGQTSSILNNDSNTNGATLTAQLVTPASQGTVVLSGDGTFTYTPNAGVASGTDTFVYQVNDGVLNSSPATVTLTIASNARPVVSNDSYAVVTNSPLTVNAQGILANDTDSDVGQTLKAQLVSQPSHGNLLLRADGSFVYTPDQGYLGVDTFTYSANDGIQDSTSLGTVSLSIATNAAPIANADTYSVNKNNTLIINAANGVLKNDTDIEPLTASVVTNPLQGSLTINSDGAFTYTPNAGVTNTTDTFVYRASDGSLSANATVTVTIKDTSSPPTPVDDTGYTVNANGTLTVTVPNGVLQNDTDPEGDALRAVSGSAPSHGTVALNSDGSFVYTPTAGYTGTDNFTYFANDGISNSLSPATVSLTIGGANQSPVITAPGSQVVFRNTDLVISGLSIGDPDAGANAVAVTLAANSGNLTLNTTTNLAVSGNGMQTVAFTGSIVDINAALANLTYRPVNAGFTGSDQITIAVNDQGFTGTGGAQTTNATISVNVTNGPALVKDINPTQNATATGTNSATPNNLTAVGSTLFFSANDGVSGVELWRSDGTDTGTSQVADLNATPDTSGSSNPSNLTVIGNTLYFTANNSFRGTELWKADLTGATSPSIVRDIRSGSGSSNPRNLVNFNGTLYFEADDGSGLVLWKTDGTTANTVKVETTVGYSQPGLLVAAGNTLYFTASNGNQLWRINSEGTQTTLLQDIGSGAGITNLVAIGNTLFFTATDSSNGMELWRSDGTTAGTTRISNINSGVGDANPSSLVNLNGTLYFFAKDESNVYKLWQSTAAGVVSSVGTLPSVGQAPTSLTVVGSKLFFVADAGTSSTPDLQLWQSDGTNASLVKAINVSGNDAVASLTNVNGSLFFTANDGSTRIWKSDGTNAGTVSVSASFTGVTPHNFTAVGSRLFFTAETTTSVLIIPDPLNNPAVFTQINGTTGEELFVL
ncbi:MAG: tandem-95 repeat protein, partial [Tildeniella nuda ZEHNDER 1965/U140]|nr:tandem-95 repeat protein [Tildeniella nuda ZEHNDER 1965/U140]